ncbi:MAG: hypothetical protein ACFCUG_10130 [Thiotrichales bacterium]
MSRAEIKSNAQSKARTARTPFGLMQVFYPGAVAAPKINPLAGGAMSLRPISVGTFK